MLWGWKSTTPSDSIWFLFLFEKQRTWSNCPTNLQSSDFIRKRFLAVPFAGFNPFNVDKLHWNRPYGSNFLVFKLKKILSRSLKFARKRSTGCDAGGPPAGRWLRKGWCERAGCGWRGGHDEGQQENGYVSCFKTWKVGTRGKCSKSRIFSTVCFQKKTCTSANSNSLDLFFFLQFWEAWKKYNTTQQGTGENRHPYQTPFLLEFQLFVVLNFWASFLDGYGRLIGILYPNMY